jgi:uncharacterized protein YjiS (DUF1127 family)
MTILTATLAPTTSHRKTGTGLTRLFSVWGQRQALRKLDRDALNDIGVTKAQASAETRRSFWDAPKTWHD